MRLPIPPSGLSIWCARRDSNPHGFPSLSESGASTNSATRAYCMHVATVVVRPAVMACHSTARLIPRVGSIRYSLTSASLRSNSSANTNPKWCCLSGSNRRQRLVPQDGIKPSFQSYQDRVLSLNYCGACISDCELCSPLCTQNNDILYVGTSHAFRGPVVAVSRRIQST